MKKSFLQNKWFYFPYLLALIVCGFILMRFSKAEIHIYCNQYYSDFANFFFKYITNLGDGIFLPLFVLIMLFIRFRHSILLVVVFLLSGLAVQLIKRLIFFDSFRPAKYFEGIHQLHLVDGVHQLSYHSFPSGHSATAFGVFLCFALVSKHNWVKAAMFVSAAIVAYSRVYLSQHFLGDIVAGSLIGVFVTMLSYTWINTFNQPWLDKNLITSKPKIAA